jgi:AcrR family transcriptional regulator
VEAARPLLATGGLPSVDEVTRAAGISRATFYRYFHSRDELIRQLDLEPDPATRERVLQTALEMVGRKGLAALSIDELATAAGVSRATVYRLFPGKAALFRELVRAYTPWETVLEIVDRMGQRPPAEVMPAVAQAVAEGMEGRVGIIGEIFLAVSRRDADTGQAADWVVNRGLVALLGYVQRQMAAGKLRPMHPLLAMQALLGPIAIHLLTRGIVQERLGLELPLNEAVRELAASWVRAMAP